MGVLSDIGQVLRTAITETPRHLAVFIFTVFAIGVVIGSLVTQHRPDLVLLTVLVPIALAFLAYVNTTFAVISFIVFVVLIVLI